jgi:hypothetical protein
MSDDDDSPTMSIVEAGWKYFRLGRSASYAAAARGDIPCIRVGRRMRAVSRALEAKLDRIAERETA